MRIQQKTRKCGINECTGYHHRLLHEDTEKGMIGIDEYCKQGVLLDDETLVSREKILLTDGDECNAIRTCAVYLLSPTGQKERIWMALDSCSTSTNIDADTAKRLKLKIRKIRH